LVVKVGSIVEEAINAASHTFSNTWQSQLSTFPPGRRKIPLGGPGGSYSECPNEMY